MSTKYDYPALEREFIEGDDTVTLRGLARREGMKSNSPISDYARNHEWDRKRKEFRETRDSAYLQLTAQESAERLARLEDRGIDLLEAMLVQGAQRLVAGTLEVSGKDLLEAITKVQLLAGKATERTEGRQVHAHVADPRTLEALEQLARRGIAGSDPGDQPKLLTG